MVRRAHVGLMFLALVTLAAVTLASFAMPIDAQQRPAIPERACARVRLDLVPTAGVRGMGLRVVNVDPGDFTARLNRDVTVEREVNGQWQQVSVAGFQLRASCAGSTPDVVHIERDSSLTIVPWTGMQGDGQCRCTRCFDAPPGRYRFVVTAHDCFTPRTTYSEPFELGPR